VVLFSPDFVQRPNLHIKRGSRRLELWRESSDHSLWQNADLVFPFEANINADDVSAIRIAAEGCLHARLTGSQESLALGAIRIHRGAFADEQRLVERNSTPTKFARLGLSNCIGQSTAAFFANETLVCLGIVSPNHLDVSVGPAVDAGSLPAISRLNASPVLPEATDRPRIRSCNRLAEVRASL